MIEKSKNDVQITIFRLGSKKKEIENMNFKILKTATSLNTYVNFNSIYLLYDPSVI